MIDTFSNIPNLRYKLYTNKDSYDLSSYKEYKVNSVIKKALTFNNKDMMLEYLDNLTSEVIKQDLYNELTCM